MIRNSRSQMIFKIGFLKNFANFTEKHLCQILFLVRLHAFKKRLQYRCFCVKFAQRTPAFTKHLNVVGSPSNFNKRKVLINRAPTSTQLHPPSLSLFQPSSSSIHLHPGHSSFHSALCNTLNFNRTKILHVLGQFPQI